MNYLAGWTTYFDELISSIVPKCPYLRQNLKVVMNKEGKITVKSLNLAWIGLHVFHLRSTRLHLCLTNDLEV